MLLLLLCGLQLAYNTWYETAACQQKPRGRILVIANTSFHTSTGMSKRLGTKVDVEKLKSVFEWLNFKVELCEDLTSHVRYLGFFSINDNENENVP